MKYLKGAYFAAILLLGTTAAEASPMLQGTSTTLTGINDLSIDGLLYNVTFVDGTCAAIYGSCDAAHFPFSSTGAGDASEAIQAAIAGTYFDTNPGILGCTSISECEILTPISIDPHPSGDLLLFWSAGHFYPGGGFLAAGEIDSTADLTNGSGLVFAVYNAATDVTPVPEPITITLFGAGFAGAFVMRRRNKKS